MGIKYLNKFLKENASDSINIIPISELNGKKIAIDISIYMYKFASEDTLIENIYLMLSIFRYYNVIPIFIFDGKPPIEKKELILKRQEEKREAEKEYKIIKNNLNNTPNMEETEKQDLINNMDMLKKKFVQISKIDIDNVKNLITAYGASYFEAIGEADELCALLTIKEKVWACLSEDMDMFVYGCPRVLRYFSLMNHTVVIYHLEPILLNLCMSQKELREICVLSGTDYNNVNDNNVKNHLNLYSILKYFKKYQKLKPQMDFYTWLQENSDYIKDIENLLKINNMFNLTYVNNNLLTGNIENIKIVKNSIQKEAIQNILLTVGFIFPYSK